MFHRLFCAGEEPSRSGFADSVGNKGGEEPSGSGTACSGGEEGGEESTRSGMAFRGGEKGGVVVWLIMWVQLRMGEVESQTLLYERAQEGVPTGRPRKRRRAHLRGIYSTLCLAAADCVVERDQGTSRVKGS